MAGSLNTASGGRDGNAAGFGLRFDNQHANIGWWAWCSRHPMVAWKLLDVFQWMWAQYEKRYPEEAAHERRRSAHLAALGAEIIPGTGMCSGYLSEGCTGMHRDKHTLGHGLLLVLNEGTNASAFVVKVGEKSFAFDTSGDATFLVIDNLKLHGSSMKSSESRMSDSGGRRFAISMSNDARVLDNPQNPKVHVDWGKAPTRPDAEEYE